MIGKAKGFCEDTNGAKPYNPFSSCYLASMTYDWISIKCTSDCKNESSKGQWNRSAYVVMAVKCTSWECVYTTAMLDFSLLFYYIC